MSRKVITEQTKKSQKKSPIPVKKNYKKKRVIETPTKENIEVCVFIHIC